MRATCILFQSSFTSNVLPSCWLHALAVVFQFFFQLCGHSYKLSTHPYSRLPQYESSLTYFKCMVRIIIIKIVQTRVSCLAVCAFEAHTLLFVQTPHYVFALRGACFFTQRWPHPKTSTPLNNWQIQPCYHLPERHDSAHSTQHNP